MRVDGLQHRTVAYEEGQIVLVDQPALPHTFRLWRSGDHVAVAEAIQTMVVRGAGAIGATGAIGLALAARQAPDRGFAAYVGAAQQLLARTRPTAQNLFYGLARVAAAITDAGSEAHPEASRRAALGAALAVANEDAAACAAIGLHGAPLLPDAGGVATHCNAGWLAFVDWGSALSPIYVAHRDGRRLFVFVDETRPRLQGAKLTAWELRGEGVPHALIADNAFGHFAATGRIQAVIVGADRVAANGDVANKIGTFGRAVIARHVGVPFYVALPSSTVDPLCPSGAQIPIEERDADEVRWTDGVTARGDLAAVRTVYDGCPARNPAFDVTPAGLVDGLITEHGVFPASREGVERILIAAGRGHEITPARAV